MDGPPMSMFSMACSSVTRRLGGGLAERIQIHAHEIDRADVVRLERGHVLRQVASREQATVHDRVQRLHATVEHFREARHIGHIGHGQAGVAQGARRATGGEQIPAKGNEARREIDDTGLVGHGEQGAWHRQS
jgi:hypothetical protein